jgi:hypothetical protein
LRHARHATRWSLAGYTRDGLAAANQFADRLQTMPETLAASTWLNLFHHRFHPDFALNGRDRLARVLLRRGLAPESLIRNRVAVLAGQTVSLLLQAAAEGL